MSRGRLMDDCSYSEDCFAVIPNSTCSLDGICVCREDHLPNNDTLCYSRPPGKNTKLHTICYPTHLCKNFCSKQWQGKKLARLRTLSRVRTLNRVRTLTRLRTITRLRTLTRVRIMTKCYHSQVSFVFTTYLLVTITIFFTCWKYFLGCVHAPMAKKLLSNSHTQCSTLTWYQSCYLYGDICII